MSEYTELCHYEMKEIALSQYKKDMPQHKDKETIITTIMSDFDGKGYVSAYPSNFIKDEIVYSFADLKKVKVVQNG